MRVRHRRMRERHTYRPTNVGATVRHVQVDRAAVVVVGEDCLHVVQDIIEVWILDLLAKVRQPAGTAQQYHLIKF